MKKRKVIIVTLIILIVLLASYVTRKRTASIDNYQFVNKYYDYPMISLLSTAVNKLIITSGMYKYGDINQDGIVDNNDLNMLNSVVKNNENVSEDQKILGDINQDNIIDDKDVLILKEYLKSNSTENYNLYNNQIKYCVITENNIDKCIWQGENEIDLKEETKYYVFAKYEDKISKEYKYSFELIDYDKYIVDDLQPFN